MADGKVVIETDLDSSGIEKGLSKIGSITAKGLKAATATIAGVGTALGGVATAAIKVGSDFEAQMSRVEAISGATGAEIEKLREQAVQLGADTAFSSKQAAEGMENLAAAGFTTSEIMDAMPGLLDLAAASGEDLANSSDIAASTLRGFGLAASEAGHVADVLAENANRTNSSVAETGEAMKYVAPLARAAGMSLEETAAAIGIMANAGIQGSQAGTTLRGSISRLSKPTKDMQEAMDELGVSFYDSTGKMKPLSEQIGMLSNAMSGMTDEQKNNYLVTLYGQEALSGMLALINEGSGSLAELTAAYETCDGSAKKAAETMQDNLAGAVEQLGGSLESLGIVFYDSVAENLKKTAVIATDSVNNITEAFNNGGLDAAINTAGDEFANLATKAAEHAPKMADVAVDFIQSFAEGITNNRGRLVNAAGEAAEALAGGLAELLPAQLQEPVDEAIEAVSRSLSSGGLKSAGKTAVKTLENVIDVAGKLAKVTLPPLTKALDFAGENMDVLASAAAACFAAFKGYKTITNTNSVLNKGIKIWKDSAKAVEAYEAAQLLAMESGTVCNATITIGQAAVGLFTSKVDLATRAQTLWTAAVKAWNTAMSASKIGLVVAAVGALAAGIGAAVLMTDRETEATGRLTEKQKDRINASKEAIESIEAEAEARQKNLAASTSEIDNAQVLWSELSKIVDANGRVKSGYEARANYITGELADALGIEIGLVDGVVTNYSELETSIYDVIAAKKAQAVLDAMESEYAEKMQEQAEKAAALADAYEKLNAKKAEQSRIEAELAEESKNYTTTITYSGNEVKRYSDKYYELEEKLKSSKNELKTLQEEFEAANIAMQDNQKVISDYNMLTEAVMSGSTEKINSALAVIQSGIDTTLQVGSEAAIQQASTTAGTLTKILQGEQEGLYQLQTQTKESLAESMGIALNQVGTGAEEMKQVLASAGEEGSAKIVAAMAQAKISGTLSAEAEAGMESFIAGFSGLDAETQAVWSQAWYGALQGLEGFEELADPAKEGADAFLESLRTALEVHSPSRAVKEIFSNVWPGASEGLEDGQEELSTTGESVIQAFLTSLSSGNLFEGARQIGSNIIQFFTGGMLGQKANVDSTSKSISDSMNTQLGAPDTQTTGTQKTAEYNIGLGSNKGNIDNTSKDISNSSDAILGSANTAGTGQRKSSEYNSGLGSNRGLIDSTSRLLSEVANSSMGSSNTGSTGIRQGSEYAAGVGSTAGMAQSEGEAISSSANTGAGTYDGSEPGSNFGSSFVNGITGWLGSAARAAADLASSAYNAAKRWLDEHSPSRKTREIGKFFSQGLAVGIEDETKTVQRASENLAETALSSIDMTDISARMREAIAINTGRVTKSFALETSTNILGNSETNNIMHLSEEDIAKLAKQFGKTAGKLVAENVDGMAIKVGAREFGRAVREVKRL